MQTSPDLHTSHPDARGNSTSGQSWTSLNHLQNVLSCVNHWYHLPFRLHSNTWKTTSLTHCLVNTSKYTSRRNPSIGKTPSVFFNSSTCTAIAKSMSQYSMWENTKSIFATLYNQPFITQSQYWLHSTLKDGHAQCTGNASAERVQYVEPQEDHTFLWPLSL